MVLLTASQVWMSDNKCEWMNNWDVIWLGVSTVGWMWNLKGGDLLPLGAKTKLEMGTEGMRGALLVWCKLCITRCFELLRGSTRGVGTVNCSLLVQKWSNVCEQLLSKDGERYHLVANRLILGIWICTTPAALHQGDACVCYKHSVWDVTCCCMHVLWECVWGMTLL